MVVITEFEDERFIHDIQYQEFLKLFQVNESSEYENDVEGEDDEEELINEVNQSAQRLGINVNSENDNDNKLSVNKSQADFFPKSSAIVNSLISTSKSFPQLCLSKISIPCASSIIIRKDNNNEEIRKTAWKELEARPKPSSDPFVDDEIKVTKEERIEEARSFILHHSQLLIEMKNFESELKNVLKEPDQIHDCNQIEKEKKAAEELKQLLEKVKNTTDLLNEYLKVLETNIKEIDDPNDWVLVQKPSFFKDTLTSLLASYNEYFLKISSIYAQVKPVVDFLIQAYEIYTSVVPGIQTIITCIPIVLAFLAEIQKM